MFKAHKAAGKGNKIMKIKHFIMKSKWGREVLNFMLYKEDMGYFKNLFSYFIYHITLQNST